MPYGKPGVINMVLTTGKSKSPPCQGQIFEESINCLIFNPDRVELDGLSTFAKTNFVQVKVFPESSLLTTEFESIRSLLRDLCISEMGIEQVNAISIHNDKQFILNLLNRAHEMRQVLASGLPFPSSDYINAIKEINLLKIDNSVLTEDQFMAIHLMMVTVKDVYNFFKNRKSLFPTLETIIGDTVYEKSIGADIEEILDEYGTVKTSASPELARIRKSLQRTRAESDRVYNQVLNKYRKLGWITESEESSRNGRRVIAVFAEQKRAIRGIIHDTSATGKTAFVEPEETIGINNSIAILEQEERLEIRRILRELTGKLRKYAPLMLIYRDQLGTFDLNRAKALLALETDAKLPQILDEPIVDLKIARHPLLLLHNIKLRKSTIPFSLLLNSEQRILVISGPNAGGKTVCMKTAGLLQMMLQSGILITAHEDSRFGIFENILVDIGDSQSIEYELSTYSSRLRHMRIFLERANEKSLFLIDEFGTGTDPDLGGALAEAVLEELNNRKSFGIITTHYLNLKVMAGRTEGIMNGSMEFDLKRLRPLYKLNVGKPGSSYTFLVAERSGLNRDLIKNARRKVARKNLMLEKLLNDVEREKDSIKNKLSEAESNDRKLKELIKQHESLSKSKESEITAKEAKLKKLEERLLKESEERFKEFLKEWRKTKDKKVLLDKYYRQFVQKKKVIDPKVLERQRQDKLKKLKVVIKPGVKVRLENGHTIGVVEQIVDEKVSVIFGQFRTLCDMANLVPVETVGGRP